MAINTAVHQRNFLQFTALVPYEDSKTVSLCLYSEKRNHYNFVNISSTVVVNTSMERSSQVLQHKNPKNKIFLFKKV